jgi:hypothetical protein
MTIRSGVTQRPLASREWDPQPGAGLDELTVRTGGSSGDDPAQLWSEKEPETRCASWDDRVRLV